MPVTIFLRLRLSDRTNSTAVGWQDRIGVNVAKSDAY